MNVYFSTKLSGHYLPAVAVAVADSPVEAAKMINEAGRQEGLFAMAMPEDMKPLDTGAPHAIILFNGDY